MLKLQDLGKRICIIGPSSSGKSTLARALGSKLNLTVCHLDQLAHIPHTNWQARDKKLFEKDHQQFLDNNQEWAIEGNYSFLMKQRFAAATYIIWLDFNIAGSLWRYLKRSINKNEHRPGNLEGATRQFSWKLIHYMIFIAPKKKDKYRVLIKEGNVKLLHLTSFSMLSDYYTWWGLLKIRE